MSATPRPWRTFLSGSDGVRILPATGDKKEDLKYIAVVNGRDLQTDQDNASLIVSAVNSHNAALALAEAVLLAREIPDPYALGEHFQKLFALASNFLMAKRGEGEIMDTKPIKELIGAAKAISMWLSRRRSNDH